MGIKNIIFVNLCL